MLCKKLPLFFSSLLLFSAACAQDNNGTVSYNHITRFGDVRLEEVPAELAAFIPKENTAKATLYFTPQTSLYQTEEEKPKESEYNSSSENIHIKIASSSSSGGQIVYTDLAGKKITEQRSFMGKKFLISGPSDKLRWKMTGRQKTLLGYPVQEAVAIGDKDTITAWFAPGVPVSSGPIGLSGLPGMILEASVGQMTSLVATAVNIGDVAGKIQAPTKGKQVTNEQFLKIVKEKEEELNQESGGHGSRKVIIRTIGN